MNRSTCVAVVLLCVSIVVAGCSHDAGGAPTPTQALKADYGGDAPGSLLSADPAVELAPQLRAKLSLSARITYVSTSGIDDSHSRVTAMVFVPKGDPPPDGWRIVALGHPATGIQPECAPSASPTLLGLLPTVAALIDAGYLVTLPDYQGLGLPDSYHPFLDSTTVGYNMIDSVRAVRKLVPAASSSFAVWGSGQGGQAAWAANELATDYKGQMKIVGAVAVAPTAALEWLADAAAAAALTRDQQLLLQQFLAALKREYSELNLDAYRRGVVKDKWDVLTACWGDAMRDRDRVIDQIGPNDLRPDNPQATEALRAYLRKTSLPQAPTAAPMAVFPDDNTGLIPRAQTDAAVARACAMGDVIQFGEPPNDDPSAIIGWITDRFNGVAANNDCDQLQIAHN